MNTKLVHKLKSLPKTSGVYLYRDTSRKIIYVGKAVNLKNRVNSYFSSNNQDLKTKELVKNIESVEWLEVDSEFEALVLEADLIKRYKPKYNIRLRDDKNYSYLKITKEDYPKVSVVHQIVDHEAEYLGPFTESQALRKSLKLARHIYPYCTCKQTKDEICLYFHLGLCLGHGEKFISSVEYKKNIKGLKKLFSQKSKKLEIEFRRQMNLASQGKEFEKAARYRDKLFYLKKIQHTQLFSDRDLASDKALSVLANSLGLKTEPKRIESFDNSNVLGTSAVGSMVVFKNGVAAPSMYRRFKIKTVKGANDFASMAETVRRRFKESTKVKKDPSFGELPDLIILDGGKGQLSAVLKNVEIPKGVKVVALAKRLEQIIVAEKNINTLSFKTINISEGSEAMYLVQRIRDEAHRFAVSYHRKLKQKELFETSLDLISGIGPKTKKKLLKEFGSIKTIKEQSLEALTLVVGEKLAQKIKENL